jgi:hypothetical protein
MCRLNHFPVAQQAVGNSCWAAAARSIVNWYHQNGHAGPNPLYGSDQALADAWSVASGDAANADINVQQSASGALADLGFFNETDSAALPTPGEIADALHAEKPLLAIIGTTVPDPDPNTEYQDGHWLVIIGITNRQPDANLLVFDPADGLVHTVPYNTSTYQAGSYWQNTSYVDPYPDATSVSAPEPDATSVSAPDPVAPPANSWTAEARGGITLRVVWTPQEGGSKVNVTVTQTAGPGADQEVDKFAKLGTPPRSANQGIWRFGTPSVSLELTLTLKIVPAVQGGAGGRGQLWAAYPLTQSEGINRVIAAWPLSASNS